MRGGKKGEIRNGSSFGSPLVSMLPDAMVKTVATVTPQEGYVDPVQEGERRFDLESHSLYRSCRVDGSVIMRARAWWVLAE